MKALVDLNNWIMSDEVYKYMNRDNNMWFCGTCLPQVRDFVKKVYYQSGKETTPILQWL